MLTIKCVDADREAAHGLRILAIRCSGHYRKPTATIACMARAAAAASARI